MCCYMQEQKKKKKDTVNFLPLSCLMPQKERNSYPYLCEREKRRRRRKRRRRKRNLNFVWKGKEEDDR